MKFRFKTQDYQTRAVSAVIDCFAGQIKAEPFRLATPQTDTGQQNLDYGGFANAGLTLAPDQLLDNIRAVQQEQGLACHHSRTQTLMVH